MRTVEIGIPRPAPPRLMPPHPSWHSPAQPPGHTSVKRCRRALRSPAGGSKFRPSHRGRAGPASENHCQNVIAMRPPLPEGAYVLALRKEVASLTPTPRRAVPRQCVWVGKVSVLSRNQITGQQHRNTTDLNYKGPPSDYLQLKNGNQICLAVEKFSPRD